MSRNDSHPFVSVVIPAFHSSATIRNALDALKLQTYPIFEVIVVNSSAEDGTEGIIREEFPEVKFFQSPARMLPHEARNFGVENSRGDLLVFTDPDCVPGREWLNILVAAFRTGREVMVGSMGLADLGWLETGIHLCKFHWLLPGLGSSFKTCAPTANAAYSRDLWGKIGPFPGELYAGDGILSRRASQCGHPPFFIPGAVTRHHHDNTFSGFCGQRYSRGRDYARARMELMGEPGFLTWLSLLFSPASLAWVLFRAGRDAGRAGWGKRFLSTVPVQVVGHFCWALGESLGAVEFFFRKVLVRGGRP